MLAFSWIAEKFLRREQRKYVAFTQCHSGIETKGRRAMSGISVLQKTRIYGKKILWMISGRKLFGAFACSPGSTKWLIVIFANEKQLATLLLRCVVRKKNASVVLLLCVNEHENLGA